MKNGLHTSDILGVRIHHITADAAVERLDAMAGSGAPHHIVTVNPEFVMMARGDPVFRSVLNSASLAIPDGIGILLASRLLDVSMPERVTGVDTVYRLAAVAARRGYTLFLLGAAPGVAETAAARLTELNPGLIIAGTYAGSPRPEEEDEICRRIEAARPHILLVAYGPPRQDLWIARTAGRLKVPVAIGVGGTLDFIAGVAVRAPAWMQRSGIEWLYRLLREPRRWRRMLSLPRFAIAVLAQRFAGTTRRGSDLANTLHQ